MLGTKKLEYDITFRQESVKNNFRLFYYTIKYYSTTIKHRNSVFYRHTLK